MRTNRLYRSKNGEFLGVCKGIADWRDLPVDGVRLGTIILFFITGSAVFWIYLILGLLLPADPDEDYQDKESRKSDRRSRKKSDRGHRMNIYDLQEEFEDLNRKLSDIEDATVKGGSKESDWERRFNRS